MRNIAFKENLKSEKQRRGGCYIRQNTMELADLKSKSTDARRSSLVRMTKSFSATMAMRSGSPPDVRFYVSDKILEVTYVAFWLTIELLVNLYQQL
jgi:hypothetical protein